MQQFIYFVWYFKIMKAYENKYRIFKGISFGFVFVLLLSVSGCTTLSYYFQAIKGQSELLQKRIPIKTVLIDKKLDNKVRQKLLIVQEARRFAVTALGLPDNNSYRDYADLQRDYVMWSVFITPAFSLKPMQWCYPVVGCISYRNYFSRTDAQLFAGKMQAQGYDVHVANVPAYSTIGWFDDPVTNTMMHWQDYDLVGTLFHELGHQKFYVKSDTVFNESLAKTIEQEGLQRWMQYKSQAGLYERYLRDEKRESAFVGIILQAREKLEKLYQVNNAESQKLSAKLDVFRALRRDYIRLRKQWNGYDAYDQWMLSGMNNAKVQSIATYYDYVPVFKRLLAEQGGNLSRFYTEVKKLTLMSQQKRKGFFKSPEK